ncbi:MAG TPA: sigma-70 family RNA polymerase sigma factor [Phototrophicaceae bacterium]|jgi:RNA polymerase sigma-70 factor (ECF subfamily)|nr:sigma-70 family RNA polymerase sigma factor [Phototrophicaceae bacterium]
MMTERTDERRAGERTNEEWLAELSGEGNVQTAALADLRERLQRSVLYYLSQERSDLRDLSTQELEQMAEDLSQDALMRIMANLTTFRGESLFTTWANRIAVRLAISDLRRARYKDFSLDNLTASGDIMPAATAIPTVTSPPDPSPEASTERNDVMDLINKAFDEALTERQFRALEAVAIRGVPMDVVAEQMGTNRNALYKLLHDARRKLRSYLETQGLSMDYIMTLFQ